ncbi:glycoside hydrolase, partial [Aureobasidium melanogenum]
MKSSTAFVSAFAVLARASPLVARQELDFNLLNAAPNVTTASIPIGPTAESVTYDLAQATAQATASALPVQAVKRDLSARAACASQPLGSGPVPSPDTDTAFLSSTDLSAAANNAVTPNGYYNTFTNLQGSSNSYGYLGFTTLASYDVQACASKCDAIRGCSGINIYFERDPTLEPADACPNPASTTTIRCVYWGGYVAAANAKNKGQWRNKFHVVIAGSNGYMKSAVPTVQGFTGVSVGDFSLNAPLDCNGKDTYMGSKLLTNSYFDPSLCAAVCNSQNQFNLANPPATGKPQLCKFFSTYMMAQNGNPKGQYCAIYSQSWDKSYATVDRTSSGSTTYTPGYSFIYSNSTSSGIPVCPNDISYLQSQAADFCTSYIGYSAPTSTASFSTVSTSTSLTSSTTTIAVTSTSYISHPHRRFKRDVVINDYGLILPTGTELLELIQIFPNLTKSTNAPLTTITMDATLSSAASTTAVADNVAAAATETSETTELVKRADTTPASIISWEPASISLACSQVATGTATVSTTSTQIVSTTQTVVSTYTAVATVTAYNDISTDLRCGPAFGNKYCPYNGCCSIYGWCGGGAPWCGSGCQSAFGTCY